MSQQEKGMLEEDDEYWDWFSVILFLLVTVDMLTTIGATIEYGPFAEANPLMKWLLLQGPVVLTVANICVVILAAYAFSNVLDAVRCTPAPYDSHFGYALEAWLGTLLALGLFIFANNISVIVHGHSLLSLFY